METFRHQARYLVKLGELGAFATALRELNAAAQAAGRPAYRAWRSQFGDLGEVFIEAEYPSLQAYLDSFDAAHADERHLTALRAMLAHVVPGTAQDRPLVALDVS